MANIRNLGILAHIDAGKTSLTERLLHTSGVIATAGNVDSGDTRTDSLELERQRGITIKSAVVSFPLDDVTVNLIDTPGHPDFIAEVERVLHVLDGAVLVVSAVEGVQAQTRILLRTLRRLRIPTLIFVNKVDRTGARYQSLLDEIAVKLSPDIVSMGTVCDSGTANARFAAFADDDEALTNTATEVLTRHDDALLGSYLDQSLDSAQLRRALAHQTAQTLAHPVYWGSAATGSGIDGLISGIKHLLPAASTTADPVSGTVFKVDRGPSGEKIAFARMFGGTVQLRQTVDFGAGKRGKITGLAVFADGGAARSSQVTAGQIAQLWGLDGVRIGDRVGQAPHSTPQGFAPPTLETVVTPDDPKKQGALHTALTQLAEQDPLINLRQDDERREISVSLYGEVQKEVIVATLANEYGLGVSFRATTTICIERLSGVGEAVEYLGHDLNPFLATVGLRVEPAPAGSGVDFRLGVELGAMPFAFFRAVEETVRQTLRQGVYGWEVPDCVVTLTHSGYAPRQGKRGQAFNPAISSSGADFRHLTPLVLMNALRRAGTRVCQPLLGFELELPEDTLGAVLPALAKLRAVAATQRISGHARVVAGEIPAARLRELQRVLPGLTRGEGVLEYDFDRYESIAGEAASRSRGDINPLHREEYLLRVARRA